MATIGDSRVALQPGKKDASVVNDADDGASRR